MLYKYVAPPSPDDHTARIMVGVKDGVARELVLLGDAVDLTEAEYYSVISNGYQLEAVDNVSSEDEKPSVEEEQEDNPAPVALERSDVPSPTQTQSFGASPPSTSPLGA